MKTNAIVLFSLITSLSLIACSNKTSASDQQTSPPVEQEIQEPEEVEERFNEEYFYGTWELVSVEQDGITATIAALEKSGNYKFSNAGIILQANGECYLYIQDDNNVVNWYVTPDGIELDDTEMSLKNNLLSLKGNDRILYFEKISDSQELPADLKTDEEASSEEPQSDLIDGMRPEFKEAMDSYEAFYTEYCEFMNTYKENPTDMTLIAKYTELLTKVVEMDEKFSEWEDEDLNDTELKYYLEVSGRITQKLLESAL